MAIVRVGAIADMETEDEIRARYQRWSKLARKEDAQVPDLSPSEITAEIVSRRVYVDVVFSEFADLANGRRIVCSDGLGFTSRGNSVVLGDDGIARPDPWSLTDLEDIAETVTELLTDERETGVARWGRLRSACIQHGIDASFDELATAPFAVEFSQRLRERLNDTNA
jgi:hypothetical protein